MGDHYRRRIKELLYEYNRPFPGPYYFSRFLTSRKGKDAKIADIGSGPVCTLGSLWSGVDIKIYASDILANEYNKLVTELKHKLLVPIEYQNMENLTYEDNFFDLVHCVNALDHTENAQKAINEMKRVVKPGGYIYLRHVYDQKTAHDGRGHYWDAKPKGFFDGKTHIKLDGFTTSDDGYFITSIMQKAID